MGYTHYYRVNKILDPVKFSAFSKDVAKLLGAINIPLAIEYDKPDTKPLVNDDEICFNGVGKDGHETFLFSRESSSSFNFCKTAMKPYDLAVTSVLILAKYHFGDSIRVSSDGDIEDWKFAFELVDKTLGISPMNRLDIFKG